MTGYQAHSVPCLADVLVDLETVNLDSIARHRRDTPFRGDARGGDPSVFGRPRVHTNGLILQTVPGDSCLPGSYRRSVHEAPILPDPV